ncbi:MULTISPECIES: exosortase K [Myxococcaceae]|uniref:exosortase K n=1 Tax=Myxococcaceae TaxID=31 RepID=UPI00129CBEB3|nr:exosortase K [Simulacricoccus sp. 17bor-14]
MRDYRPAHRRAVALLLLTLLFASGLGLKAHAARTDARGLRWLLAPTATLVTSVSGVPFEDEGGAGLLNRERRFAIVPACAGVNFLVVALWTLGFGFVRAQASPERNAAVATLSAAGSYAMTLLANTARILGALALHARAQSLAGLSPAELHRLEGIGVYLVALCAVFWLASRLAGEPLRLALPLCCYLAVTLGLPLLRGAPGGPLFWRHAAWVFAGAALVAIVAWGLSRRTSLTSLGPRSN